MKSKHIDKIDYLQIIKTHEKVGKLLSSLHEIWHRHQEEGG